MGSFHGRVVWSERRNGNKESFVGSVQIFTDKVVTSLKSIALMVYPAHAILLNVSLKTSQ